MDQLKKRYGRPSREMHNNVEAYRYAFHGYTILVGFDQGISQCEVYLKLNHSRMSEPEIDELLEANASRSPWSEEPDETIAAYVYWSLDKKSRVALYNLATHTLMVTSKPFLTRFGPLINSSEQKKGSEGF
jgi:hypothetical protein